MSWHYDELPSWEREAREAHRYNLEASRRQGGEVSRPLGYERKYTDEERRASLERLRAYQAERAREQVAAYYARKAASLARDS